MSSIDRHIDPSASAELVESIHQPWRASVEECVRRWRALDAAIRERSFLVLCDEADRRRTLNARRIAELAAELG